MAEMKAILAATDLSAPARHAARRAAMLAQQSGARLHLAHVLPDDALDTLVSWFSKETPELRDKLQAQATESMRQLAVDIGVDAPHAADWTVLHGPVVAQIVQQTQDTAADLLVVGARGEAFLRHWLLGTTAERLVRKCRRPVLVVKPPPREPYRSVLVAVDFSPWSVQSVGLARRLAPQAELVLLHASELPYEGKMRLAGVTPSQIQQYRDEARRLAQQELEKLALDAGITTADWRPLVRQGDPALLVLEQVEDQGADLIVLGKHGSGMVDDLLLGSVTQQVLPQAACDVLVVSAPR